MKRIRLSLASSAELKGDRVEFENTINRINKMWVDKGIFIETMMWEDFLDAFSPIGLQQEYNKQIKEGDIFVMLYHTKVGPYTAQEFDTAIQAFQEHGKPVCFIFFKEAPHSNHNEEEARSLELFQQKLLALSHFPTRYKNAEDLCGRIFVQLEKLLETGFLDLEGIGNQIGKSVSITPIIEYQLSNILNLLTYAFTPSEFEEFTLAQYPAVHRQFTNGSLQPQRIQLLLTYCQTRGLLTQLLGQVRAWNPYQYGRLGPYENGEASQGGSSLPK
jgi:hypothetical protein